MLTTDNKQNTEIIAASQAEYDVVIVGAGVLGAALASSLGRDGHNVALIERDWSEPDRIVGELLQPGGVEALRTLGLSSCLEDIDAIESRGYHVEYEGQAVHIAYPTNPNTGLSYTGCSFHHGRFITKLREACENVKAVTIFEATANELIRDGADGITVTGVRCTSKLVIIADGCMSKFRKEVAPPDGKNGAHGRNPVARSSFVGFLMQQCQLPRPNHGHVFLGKPSPILMYQVDTNETRVLVDVPGKLPSASSGALAEYMRNVAAKDIPVPAREAFLKALETERLRSMPNQYLPPSRNTEPGVLLIGDAFNMRHPLTGGGMTVALWDAVHIRDILYEIVREEHEYSGRLQYIGGEQLRQTLVSELRKRRWNRAACINILAMALYSLFAADESDEEMKILREGCFRFFELGPAWVAAPAGFLSGVKPEPFTLLVYFFTVAFYSVYVRMIDAKNPLRAIGAFLHGFKVIYAAAVVFFPVLYVEFFA
ncbi:putative squalene monooxygenase [Ramicandelaber brevisporus]|nr:putative squalene monooxygenase [Ramicandelaber brevisporus]